MTESKARNFIEAIIEDDLKNGRVSEIVTRFPPEPNGYLHIGHAKSICLNFGTAIKYGGRCNLRYDDTNPVKEDEEYIRSIERDVRWLGFEPAAVLYGSDYFEYMFEKAMLLIEKGLAYVCDLSAEQIREYRGTLTEPGKNSPYRDRSVEENRRLFLQMREGKYKDGEKVLRAKIDMASPNLNMRDPVLYRILHATHHRTGDKWCIYPMYDFAHPLEDAYEGITHSICTLEFEDHRPLYDWVIENCECVPAPRQYEFARLNMTRTIMSKRYLKKLVDEGVVSGWDDPRMPTISGLRRRGYTPEAIRDFCERIGVAKSNSEVDVGLLEHCVREHLGEVAPRRMVVLDPLKVVIENYEGDGEYVLSENLPKNEEAGRREVRFSREIYIERADFMEEPPPKFFRLAPGREVRLKDAYIIKCESVIKDENGNITELRCTYDPGSKTGGPTAGRKVKGTLHWVDAASAIPCEVRLYDYLLNEDSEGDFSERLNPDSLKVMPNALAERALADAAVGDKFQFLRQGYFCKDPDSTEARPVFNLIVSLKDSYAKSQGA
ncbi:MAG: glutamine--tRNA ligase/YqeY domain fusion protein [Christensenellaceae bacterium]|nr:glutamine--tRNA ligase/YqeY domain fusion protein [Christensenellaceae bacterium]